jgi:RNA polymerase sigma factor (sigma-70 family)
MAVVAGMEWKVAFSPGSASWAAHGGTALMSGVGEANGGTEALFLRVPEAHTAVQGLVAQSYLAPSLLTEGFGSPDRHPDSTRHLDALFAGASGPRFGGAGLNHFAGLNPSPPAPEEESSDSWPVASVPNAAGLERLDYRARPSDQWSDPAPLEDTRSEGPAYGVSSSYQLSDPAPSDNVGVRAGASVDSVVTPSVMTGRSSASHGTLVDVPVDSFRITRSPVSNATMEVRFALTEYSSTGAVRNEYVVAIPSGAAHVDIRSGLPPAGQANGTEIVTLTLLSNGDYQIVQPTVARFIPGNARDCSEPALIAAFQQEKLAEAFSALVARNRSSVMRTCYGVLGNWHDAEDVTQMVFLILAQQQMQLQNSLVGWLRTVARNAAIAFLRSRARRARHESRSAKPIMVASEEPQHELREELDVALNQLSPPLRDAVHLRYIEGWSQAEAARMVGCPRGTLSQRAALGVRQLRSILGQGNGPADKD